MKKRITIAAGILLLACMMILWAGSRSGQAGIRRFVLSHQAELEEIAADCLSQGRTVERYNGVEVEGAYPGAFPIVQFYTGGWGLVPSAAYWGFYYSESGPERGHGTGARLGERVELERRHGQRRGDPAD